MKATIRLLELRIKHKITQFELAKKIEVSQSTISKWESGTREPKIDEIIKLAKYFGESTDFLLGADEI